jgi:CubicO group peptidase (beta-lactamase class C family)
MTLRVNLGACVLAMAGWGCLGSGPGAPDVQVPDDALAYVPEAEWRTAQPAAVGLDSIRVEALRANVAGGRYGAVQGLIVVRFGYLAIEQYVGWSRDRIHTMQSVTKSVTSLLYGIHSAGGTASGEALDRPVVDIFGRYTPIANLDQAKRALTIRNLLTMRTGMDFWEQPYAGSPLDQLNRSTGDWTRFILDRPMTGTPGTIWAYNSGAAILTCAVMREVSGENPDVFARRALFAPLGISGEDWFRSPYDGLPHCGGGLYLKPVDLARIGYLVLRRGRWGDQQIVPQAWMDLSTRAVTRGSPVYFSEYDSGYGYLWWLFPGYRGATDLGVIAASGAGGQWLFVVPRYDLVVVVVANNGDGLNLLYDELLPAVAR